MANGVYNKGKLEIWQALTDLDSADMRVLLVKDTYTFDATHQFVSDVIAGLKEISVTGYARQALANKVAAKDDVNNIAYLDADDVIFTQLVLGQTIGGAVLFRNTGVDSTSPVIAFYDLTDAATNGSNFVVQWNTPANGGVLKAA